MHGWEREPSGSLSTPCQQPLLPSALPAASRIRNVHDRCPILTDVERGNAESAIIPDVTTALAITALVVAVAAAIAQAIQNQRQSARNLEVQTRLADVEESRRRDEVIPRLQLRYVENPDDLDGSLEWVNEGPQDLDEVTFTLIERSGAGWQPLRGVRFIREGWTVTEGSLGEIKIGEPVAHGLVRTPGSEDDGGVARFRMVCVAGDASWEFPLECRIPPLGTHH